MTFPINRFLVFLMLQVFLASSCQSSQEEVKKKKKPKLIQTALLNQLTSKEVAAGWELLFDGKKTKNWRSFQSLEFPKSGWYIDIEGNLVGDESGIDLMTQRKFENFDLKLEFQISSSSDSGIYYRIPKSEDTLIWTQALEYQIIDPDVYKNVGDISLEKHSTGDLYGMFDSEFFGTDILNKWNRARIVILNNYVEHWLNDELILTYKFDSENWDAQFAKSKFYKYSNFGKTQYGYIGLVGSNSPVKFRNIKIKEL